MEHLFWRRKIRLSDKLISGVNSHPRAEGLCTTTASAREQESLTWADALRNSLGHARISEAQRRMAERGWSFDLASPYIQRKKCRFDDATQHGFWVKSRHDREPPEKDLRPCGTGTDNFWGARSCRPP